MKSIKRAFTCLIWMVSLAGLTGSLTRRADAQNTSTPKGVSGYDPYAPVITQHDAFQRILHENAAKISDPQEREKFLRDYGSSPAPASNKQDAINKLMQKTMGQLGQAGRNINTSANQIGLQGQTGLQEAARQNQADWDAAAAQMTQHLQQTIQNVQAAQEQAKNVDAQIAWAKHNRDEARRVAGDDRIPPKFRADASKIADDFDRGIADLQRQKSITLGGNFAGGLPVSRTPRPPLDKNDTASIPDTGPKAKAADSIAPGQVSDQGTRPGLTTGGLNVDTEAPDSIVAAASDLGQKVLAQAADNALDEYILEPVKKPIQDKLLEKIGIDLDEPPQPIGPPKSLGKEIGEKLAGAAHDVAYGWACDLAADKLAKISPGSFQLGERARAICQAWTGNLSGAIKTASDALQKTLDDVLNPNGRSIIHILTGSSSR